MNNSFRMDQLGRTNTPWAAALKVLCTILAITGSAWPNQARSIRTSLDSVEAVTQILETGKIEDLGRIGAAAGGGMVAGTLFMSNPAAGVLSSVAGGAGSGVVGGATTRLINSGGRSAGTLSDVATDATLGGLTAGVFKGGGALLRKVLPKKTVTPPTKKPVGSQCFVSGTLIHTARGLVPIEDIEVGDWVLSQDENVQELTYKPVTQLFVTEDAEVLRLDLEYPGGIETLRVTPEHPFYVQGQGWMPAGALTLGTELSIAPLGSEPANQSTDQASLARLTVALTLEERATVYNFEVDETHSYFVGESGAWVHNTCGPKGGSGSSDTVRLFHGSIDNASSIRKNGLDPKRTPTWVTTSRPAAENAIGPNRVLSSGQGADKGIIESVVPRGQFEALQQSGGISQTRGWPGFGTRENLTENVLRSEEAVNLFNGGIQR